MRPDIASLARTPNRLARLEAAIGEMQRRSRVDPDDAAGWQAHARNHLQRCAAVSNADAAQIHGCWWFLPWHRAFLAVTEMKLRAISGDPELALPYWNWSSDRSIPAPFTRPGSPLSQALRHTPNRPLRSAEVDWLPHDPECAALGVAGLGAAFFQADSRDNIPASFGGIANPNPHGWHGRSRLEIVPHTAIHNYVGGEAADGSLGDMTELATAALDPVFYAHHANLDRLWEIWRRDPGRKMTEPDSAAFTGKSFVFPWLDGTAIEIAVADTLDTRRLGYVYQSLAVFRDNAVPRPADAAVDLARQPLAVETLRLPVSSAPQAGHTVLIISGVEPAERPMTTELVIAAAGDPASAVVVGAFAAGRKHGPASFPDTELRFDVTAAVRRLGAAAFVVSVLPLALGRDVAGPAPFTYQGMAFVHVG